MQGRTATIIGATGLIGRHLVEILKEGEYFDVVRLLIRRPLMFNHPKLDAKFISFEDHESFKIGIDGSDAVFCAVGTTQKKVRGDKTAYRKVDYDIPTKAARFCEETGCQNFMLVSSVGASSGSNNFYLKLKGEVEDDVQKRSIGSMNIFRPSILLGQREESRPAEKIGQAAMSALSFLIPSKYKAVNAEDVAQAMLAAAKASKPGMNVYHYKEIQELCRH